MVYIAVNTFFWIPFEMMIVMMCSGKTLWILHNCIDLAFACIGWWITLMPSFLYRWHQQSPRWQSWDWEAGNCGRGVSGEATVIVWVNVLLVSHFMNRCGPWYVYLWLFVHACVCVHACLCVCISDGSTLSEHTCMKCWFVYISSSRWQHYFHVFLCKSQILVLATQNARYPVKWSDSSWFVHKVYLDVYYDTSEMYIWLCRVMVLNCVVNGI